MGNWRRRLDAAREKRAGRATVIFMSQLSAQLSQTRQICSDGIDRLAAIIKNYWWLF